MAYEAKTQNDLAKWWVIGTSADTNNRLSDILVDFPLGPAIYYTTGWTASAPEYYRTQATANDSAQEKIGAGAWAALVLGAGVGLLTAGQYFYDVGTTRLYVRLTGDAAPNATNQVRAHYVWNGAGAGPAWMTEDVVDEIYKIHVAFELSDGSTATTLVSLKELIKCDQTVPFEVQTGATFTMGELVSSYGRNGSTLILGGVSGTSYNLVDGGTVNLYDSKLRVCQESRYQFNTGNLTAISSTIEHRYDVGASSANNGILLNLNMTSIVLTNVYFNNIGSLYWYFPVTATNVHIHNTATIIFNQSYSMMLGCTITALSANLQIAVNAYGCAELRNPTTTIESIAKAFANTDAEMLETYTLDLTIVDKDGTAISGATVQIYDDNNNLVSGTLATTTLNEDIDSTETAIDVVSSAEWTGAGTEIIRCMADYMTLASKAGNTLTVTRSAYGSEYPNCRIDGLVPIWNIGSLTTDANGQINQQILPYKFWYGTSETLYNPNPYKIVISKSGYETLTLENITIDSPIDWHLELQDEPTDADVAQAVWTYANRTLTG